MFYLCFSYLQEGLAFAHCTTCKAPYHLRVHVVADRKWRTLKFRFFVTRDILFIFLAVQLVGHYNFLFFSFLFSVFIFCCLLLDIMPRLTRNDVWKSCFDCVILISMAHPPCYRLLLCWHIWCISSIATRNFGFARPGVSIADSVFTTYVVKHLQIGFFLSYALICSSFHRV